MSDEAPRFTIRDALAAAGLSQTDAARLLGIDGRTMRRYCADAQTPSYRPLPEPTRRLLSLLVGMPAARTWLETHL